MTIAGEEPTGAMVALVPARPQALAVDGGEELGALHLTLKFLGDAADWPADQRAVVERTVADWAAQTPRFTGTVGGAGRLGTDGAMVWHLDVPGLARSREALSAWIDDRTDADTSDRWDGFTPHVTFAYDDADLPDLPDGDVPFFDAVLCWGPDRTVIPLSGTLGRSAAVLPRDGDGDGFVYDGTKREMLAPARMLDIDIDMELEADVIGERRNAPIGRVQPSMPKPRAKDGRRVRGTPMDADVWALRPDTKKGDKKGGKAMLVAALNGSGGAVQGGMPGFRAVRTVRQAVDQMTANLEAVWESAKKRPEFVARAKRWYEAARERGVALADKLDMHPDGGAAVLAALSPSMDWNYNLAQADALAEFWLQDPEITGDLYDKVLDLVNTRLNLGPGGKLKKDADLVHMPERSALVGRHARSQVDDPLVRAAFARVWATDNVPEGSVPDVVTMGPDGHMAPTGKTKSTMWQTGENIAKALSIMDDPSRANVDIQLGDGVKVRSFYNNIRDPFDERNDVTIDTHAGSQAVGAPWAGNDEPFKTILGRNNTVDGPVVQLAMIQAFRQFAEAHPGEFDFPREAQSVLWELWRAAGEARTKDNKAAKAALRDAWAAVDEPGISESVRKRRRAAARKAMVAWMDRRFEWIDYDPRVENEDGTPVVPSEGGPDVAVAEP